MLVFIFYLYLYALKYKNLIKNYSLKYNLEYELVAGLICIESSFDNTTISSKGAVGLMQILPSTAEWLCELNNIEYNDDKLTDPEFNINLGCYYLNLLIKKFDNVDTAIVAYNAGEGTVKNWLKSEEYSNDGITLKNIPYKESREYLTKVKRCVNIYKDRF